MTTATVLDKVDEISLVAKSLAGDGLAFAQLMQNNERRIKYLVQRIVNDVDLVEDVVQETFLKAYNALAQFRGEAQFSTWLYSIASNTAKKMLAELKLASQQVSLLADWQQQNPALDLATITYDTPENLLQAKQTNELLQRALDLLPPRLQEVLFLREINGLSYAEIAQTMSCSIGTVRSRIFRAREAIAAKLNNWL